MFYPCVSALHGHIKTFGYYAFNLKKQEATVTDKMYLKI